MSLSTRSRRGMVYGQSSGDDIGYVTQRYELRGTYFCRLDVENSEEKTVGDQAEHAERVVIEFSDAVTLGQNDVVSVGGTQYRVGTVHTRRLSRTRIAHAVRVDDDVYLRLLRYNVEATFGGTVTHEGYVSALS